MDKKTFNLATYHIVKRAKTSPAPMNLAGAAGSRIVLNTAKRVIETHKDVIKALANR